MLRSRGGWLGQRWLSSKGSGDGGRADLVVIGGGSGGLACAKEAASLGARVVVVDAVEPSPAGTSWGLGGTCVNVGCIPKKLFHQAALLRHALSDAQAYGWSAPKDAPSHDWAALAQAVQGHIKSLNWGHRVVLKDKDARYLNGFGSFLGPNKVRVALKGGKEEVVETERTVVAVGMRPKYPDIPGAELGVSSDDLFTLKKAPGKTLVVGGGYVGLGYAGFLQGLGQPATLLLRSIPLRGFDRQMADLVLDSVKAHGLQVVQGAVLTSVTKTSAGRLAVEWSGGSGEFDTVLWAMGREARLASLGLDKAGVELGSSGRVTVDEEDRTTAQSVFAIGDVADGRPELTPSAILAGKLLARRLFAGASTLMDYQGVPTTVFTPLEYGCVGESEEEAVEARGEEAVEVFHAFYKPLEWQLPDRDAQHCYVKVIAERGSSQRLLGLHFTGPSAGEVVQGFAAALKAGLTLPQLHSTLAIHPTSAEEIIKAHITKRSGAEASVTGC